jgi:hypothetical protein
VCALLIVLSVAAPARSQTVPFVQQAPKLVASGGVGSTEQGTSVALSADGNTAVVGAPGDQSEFGAAWVWTRNNGVWAQGPKLVGSGAVGPQVRLGTSVAISADGNTALASGPADDGGVGAVWVWTRAGAVWTQQGSKLIGSGQVGTNTSRQLAVALSADGSTILVGRRDDNNGAGAVWAWTRSGGAWSQQGAKLVGSGAVGAASQGTSVALSADGDTAVVGGPYDDNQMGAAWVWTRSNAVWTQQGSKLIGGFSGTGPPWRGSSVALSADGNTALIGAPKEGADTGAATVWTRSNGEWSEGRKMYGYPFVMIGRGGSSVALSADGNTALIGAPRARIYGTSQYVGAIWVWTRSTNGWEQDGSKLLGSGFEGDVDQGASVALSGDGRTALAGGPADNGNIGAAWAFTRAQRAVSLSSNDFDGDGKADPAVYRPMNGYWFILSSESGYVPTASAWWFQWGLDGDQPVPADFDADGKLDIAVYRPGTGEWFIRYSSKSYAPGAGAWWFQWGLPGDTPITGDFDGDGKADLVLYRPSNGLWLIRYSSLGYAVAAGEWWFQWGLVGDIPLAADFDGDGRTELAVYRPTTGEWLIRYSSRGYVLGAGPWYFQWGLAGDSPILGDFDGDGKADLAVYRARTGEWYIRNSSQGYEDRAGNWYYQWGLAGDAPRVADFDGDGKTDPTVYRGPGGEWMFRYSLQNYLPVAGEWWRQWGMTGDMPVPVP